MKVKIEDLRVGQTVYISDTFMYEEMAGEEVTISGLYKHPKRGENITIIDPDGWESDEWKISDFEF
jgi:hypothetical protein